MGYVVRMPQLGMTMETGVIASWAVDPGAAVEAGDLVAVIESEKTTNDLEARESGILHERFVDVDVPVEPGTPIGYVGAPDESVPDEVGPTITDSTATDTAAAAESPSTTPASPLLKAIDESTDERISPRARSYAAQHDIDLTDLPDIEGSGPGGAIIERDLIEVSTSSGTELTGLRGAVAEQMTAGAAVPQVTLTRSVPVDQLQTVRKTLAADTSIEDFVIAAARDGLQAHPSFNAHFDDGSLTRRDEINVGIAVDVDRGLVTPVLRDIGETDLATIVETRRSLVTRTLDGDYTAADLADGTFTVTNLGHFGVEEFDPILNVPQVAILGIGAITHRPTDDGRTSVPHLPLSLTFDHRPNDGADAARFLETIAEQLSDPTSLVATDIQNASESDPLPGHRRARAESSTGMQARIRARGHTWLADEPTDRGGSDAAPTPVEGFLGSLAACLSLTIRIIGDRRDVPIDAVAVDVSAEPDTEAIEAIDIEVTIPSGAMESDLERVVETAERACYVSRIIADDIERTLDLTIVDPDEGTV